jgi:hypothetical protein
VLVRFAAGGLSVRAFCRREKLAESAFYFWRREIAQRDAAARAPSPDVRRRSPPGFLPVLVNDVSAGDGRDGGDRGAITLELIGGRVLRLPVSISAERLAELVAALEARPTVAETIATEVRP